MPTLKPNEEKEDYSEASVTVVKVPAKNEPDEVVEEASVPQEQGDSSFSHKPDEQLEKSPKLDPRESSHQTDDNLGNGNANYSRNESNKSAEGDSIFSSYSDIQSIESQSLQSTEWVTVPGSNADEFEPVNTEHEFFEKESEKMHSNHSGTLTQEVNRANETLEEVTSISEESLTVSNVKDDFVGKIPSESYKTADTNENSKVLKDEETIDFKSNEELTKNHDEEAEDSEWLDVIGSGDIMKKITKAGDGKDTRPDRNQVVTVNLAGRLDDGRVVECCEGLKFTIGDAEVIQGLDLALPLIEKNETAEILVKPRFAYGSLGKRPEIPPNATLTYTIELLDVEDEPEIDLMPLPERLNLGNQRREKGNFWYGRGEYAQGVVCYRRALEFLDDENQNFAAPANELQELLETRLKVFNNIAAAQLKLEAFDAAMKSIDSVLRVQPDNVKALFRKGKILAAQGNLNEAINYMKKALHLEPETKVIHQELSRLMEKKKTQTKSEKDMYRRMMGLPQEEETKKNGPSSFTMWGTILGGIAAVLVGIIVYRHYHGDGKFSLL